MSKPYSFNQKAQVGHWETGIDKEQQYGYFEHGQTGTGGGLWFENNVLVDADGTTSVPKQVIEAIRSFGYTVPEEFE